LRGHLHRPSKVVGASEAFKMPLADLYMPIVCGVHVRLERYGDICLEYF
jgi:hypothetical protein